MPHFDDTQLDELQQTLAERLTKKDFTSAFQRVLDVVVKTQKKHEEMLARLNDLVSSVISKLQKDHEFSRSELKRMVSEGFMGEEFKKLSATNSSTISKLEKGLLSLQAEASKSSKSAEVATSLSVAGSARITEAKNAVLGMQSVKQDVELQIAELKKEIEKLRDVRSNRPMGRAKVPMPRMVDLTSEQNGEARVFTLPPDTVRIFGGLSSQFPFAIAAGDISLNGNRITLDDTVAPREAGQTLLIFTDALFYP